MAKIRLRGDRVIWFIVAIFAMISIIAVFSVGSFLTKNNPEIMSKTDIWLEQFGSVALGFAALFLCYAFNYNFYRKIAPYVFGISVLMLVMLFVPGLQDERNGAVRGLKLMGHTIQVFEFVKVGLVLFISWGIEKYSKDIRTFKGFVLRLLVWVIGVCAIIMVNSFSSALLLGVVSMMVFYFMDVKFKYLAITAAGAVALIVLVFGIYHAALAISPKAAEAKIFNRIKTAENRVKNFASNDKDSTADLTKLTREQLEQIDRDERQSESAKIAIKEGGIFGKGVGNGTARYSLSMAFSDFIFAAIVEETGLIGGIVIVLLYLIFLFRCIRLSFKCPDAFSQALVLGLAFLITTQAFLHILVNVRLIPITGHTLPLISHGGTAYLVLSAAFGIILSVSRTVSKMEEERLAEEAAAAAENQDGSQTTVTETKETEQQAI
ncbi:MAG: FtsW/RodA/SpoVE family cell cycle protein [Bacteroidales bacterium]|nr:FtsW/RodA/SpoVE family cell cycle protein [Bacteroidales bacterium]MBQ7459740.1 FtsW/RodA/SpoVE family cell cycle protein [Bacteroidales bacterium]